MAEYIIKTKSKKEEKVGKAFLSSLDIDFYTEAQEDEALYKKMQEDQKSPLLSQKEKEEFVKQLRASKMKYEIHTSFVKGKKNFLQKLNSL